jgi:hypothetical protein
MNSKNCTNYWALITRCNHQIYATSNIYDIYLLEFAYSNHNKHTPDQSHGENSSCELTKATKSFFEPLEHTSLIKFIMCLSSLSWFVWSYPFLLFNTLERVLLISIYSGEAHRGKKKRDAVEESIHWIFLHWSHTLLCTTCCLQCGNLETQCLPQSVGFFSNACNEPAQVPRLLSSVECTMFTASAFVHHLLWKTRHVFCQW